MILALIAGTFILLGAAFNLFVAAAFFAFFSLLLPVGLGPAGSLLFELGALGIVIGAVIALLGVLMYAKPQAHAALGALIIVLSVVSLATSFLGGFLVGVLLGLIGGGLGMTWKPSRPAVLYVTSPAQPRLCRQCGGRIESNARFCPFCGSNLG
jgi:hypothetical protein